MKVEENRHVRPNSLNSFLACSSSAPYDSSRAQRNVFNPTVSGMDGWPTMMMVASLFGSFLLILTCDSNSFKLPVKGTFVNRSIRPNMLSHDFWTDFHSLRRVRYQNLFQEKNVCAPLYTLRRPGRRFPPSFAPGRHHCIRITVTRRQHVFSTGILLVRRPALFVPPCPITDIISISIHAIHTSPSSSSSFNGDGSSVDTDPPRRRTMDHADALCGSGR
ncbi:hypothetical protein DFJ77DRAFT_116403 [Powellomyces hirtus]|nr:hypothetical protein DFJ77DRAFT_116403 [Powellomyces hirtus]